MSESTTPIPSALLTAIAQLSDSAPHESQQCARTWEQHMPEAIRAEVATLTPNGLLAVWLRHFARGCRAAEKRGHHRLAGEIALLELRQTYAEYHSSSQQRQFLASTFATFGKPQQWPTWNDYPPTSREIIADLYQQWLMVPGLFPKREGLNDAA